MTYQGSIETTGLDDFDLDEALDTVAQRREERREMIRAFLQAIEELNQDPEEVFPK